MANEKQQASFRESGSAPYLFVLMLVAPAEVRNTSNRAVVATIRRDIL